MERRLELHSKLVAILGNNHCYFNPPESVKLSYPCIIYHRENGDSKYSDNQLYRYYKSYQITVISKDPDCDISDKILKGLKLCQFERFFIADDLNHWVLRAYY